MRDEDMQTKSKDQPRPHPVTPLKAVSSFSFSSVCFVLVAEKCTQTARAGYLAMGSNLGDLAGGQRGDRPPPRWYAGKPSSTVARSAALLA